MVCNQEFSTSVSVRIGFHMIIHFNLSVGLKICGSLIGLWDVLETFLRRLWEVFETSLRRLWDVFIELLLRLYPLIPASILSPSILSPTSLVLLLLLPSSLPLSSDSSLVPPPPPPPPVIFWFLSPSSFHPPSILSPSSSHLLLLPSYLPPPPEFIHAAPPLTDQVNLGWHVRYTICGRTRRWGVISIYPPGLCPHTNCTLVLWDFCGFISENMTINAFNNKALLTRTKSTTKLEVGIASF